MTDLYTFAAEKQAVQGSFMVRAHKGPCCANRLSRCFSSPAALPFWVSFEPVHVCLGFGFMFSSIHWNKQKLLADQLPYTLYRMRKKGKTRVNPAPFHPASLAVAYMGSVENVLLNSWCKCCSHMAFLNKQTIKSCLHLIVKFASVSLCFPTEKSRGRQHVPGEGVLSSGAQVCTINHYSV